MRSSHPLLLAGSLLFAALSPSLGHAAALEGNVKIDGSSTVFPITEAVAEEFQKANPKVRVTVGVSGTGGGLKKFIAGEIDIADASRPVKADEAAKAKEAGIEFMELAIAFDGLSVVVNPKNTWAKSMTMAQLKKIWEPGSTIKTWKDVDAAWPDKAIKLYGPGADSGTFEYFTETVNGKAKASRSDYTASEDDNTLVNGVAGDQYALGYFGYGYYVENKTKLTAVALSAGADAVAPSDETITSHKYPLSRPIFIVVAKKAAGRPEVDAFVKFYLKEAATLSHAVGYTPLPAQMYQEATTRYTARTLGNWPVKASH